MCFELFPWKRKREMNFGWASRTPEETSQSFKPRMRFWKKYDFHWVGIFIPEEFTNHVTLFKMKYSSCEMKKYAEVSITFSMQMTCRGWKSVNTHSFRISTNFSNWLTGKENLNIFHYQIMLWVQCNHNITSPNITNFLIKFFFKSPSPILC